MVITGTVVALGTIAAGGIGALIGSALQTTDKGKEMDKHLEQDRPLLGEACKICSKFMLNQSGAGQKLLTH